MNITKIEWYERERNFIAYSDRHTEFLSYATVAAMANECLGLRADAIIDRMKLEEAGRILLIQQKRIRELENANKPTI